VTPRNRLCRSAQIDHGRGAVRGWHQREHAAQNQSLERGVVGEFGDWVAGIVATFRDINQLEMPPSLDRQPRGRPADLPDFVAATCGALTSGYLV
jgi:hypothetical protein